MQWNPAAPSYVPLVRRTGIALTFRLAPLRAHAQNPLAEELYGFLIDLEGGQGRHLTATAAGQALVEDGTVGVAGCNEPGVANVEGMVERTDAEEVGLV